MIRIVCIHSGKVLVLGPHPRLWLCVVDGGVCELLPDSQFPFCHDTYQHFNYPILELVVYQ